MFRALVWKEWRQLRMLRFFGSVFLVLMPPVVFLILDLAQRGWIPYGRVSSYDQNTVMTAVVPWCMTGAWFVITLLMVSQVLTTDRSTGTESFLIERPVRRSRVWQARLLAAVGSILITVAVSLAFWLFYTSVMAEPNQVQWNHAFYTLSRFGTLTLVVSFLGGMASAALLDSPMGAFLLGAVLTVLPPGLAALLTAAFPYVRYREISLGVMLSVLLPAAFLVCSYATLCRGEPAGRGRYRRAVLPLAAGLALLALLFVVGAPLCIDANTNYWMSRPHFYPSPTGEILLMKGRHWASECWLIDTESGEIEAALSPGYGPVTWSPDGKKLVMLSRYGTLGTFARAERIEIYDSSTGNLRRTVEVPADISLHSVIWMDSELIYRAVRIHENNEEQGSRREAVFLALSPDKGGLREIRLDVELGDDLYRDWHMFGSGDSSKLYLAALNEEYFDAALRSRQSIADERPELEYTLYELTVAGDAFSAVPLLRHEKSLYMYRLMSLSGKYYLRVDNSEPTVHGTVSVRDMETGEEYRLDNLHYENAMSEWLADDSLVWIERQNGSAHLISWRPGGEPRTVWKGPGDKDYTYIMRRSPDHARVLIWMTRRFTDRKEARENYPGEYPLFERPDFVRMHLGNLIYDPVSGECKDFPVDGSAWPYPKNAPEWAGPRTLVWADRRQVALESIDNPGVLRYVIN